MSKDKQSTSKEKKKTTPLMKQYNSIKAQYPDACLLFRVGDFYETFGQDAIRTAKILGIVLTKRGNGSESETALAGFPHHSLNTYLPKLVKAGLRVAVCDQLEDPKLTKKIVKRGVTELITPGVTTNDQVLEAKTNNYLCSISFSKNHFGISFLDISTGEFYLTEGNKQTIDKLLQDFNPSEILIIKKNKLRFNELFSSSFHTYHLENWIQQIDYSQEILNKHFHTNSLKGFGIENMNLGIIAAGTVFHYLKETHQNNIQHITKIQKIFNDHYLWMDRFTVKNLELFPKSKNESIGLIDIIDNTQTPMGGRLIKRWLALPLIDLNQINERLDTVEFFINHQDKRTKISELLKNISDIERLVTKLATDRINPRELSYLNQSLKKIAPIKNVLSESDNSNAIAFYQKLDTCQEFIQIIDQTLLKEAPISIGKSPTINKGVNQELDELNYLASSSKEYLDKLVQREIKTTAIPSLKIAFNNVFGYYIEVRNTHKDKVPQTWIRKQTLVNSERYITEELKEYESKILGAQEKILLIEKKLYQDLLNTLSPFIESIQKSSKTIAKIDCLCGFAQLAINNHYTKPLLNDSHSLKIKAARHPVIESQLAEDTPYIANDIVLNPYQEQILMITGPNMSGKSAILRQTALIVIMAQIGCYIPADSATIGITDKIFTRVGASDNISMGESTFMVEMNETATILNNISDRSLILLDEIGRGTSTYDGISIAWAITEFLHQHPAKPKTLFATHYHELNEMETTFENIVNYNVSVKETKKDVLFIRKLERGGSAHSFGIHVAKMAGIPQIVIQNAKRMLKKLEKSRENTPKKSLASSTSDPMQLSFFNLDDPTLQEIKEELNELSVETLTPVEALIKLNEFKKKLS